ncbi:MAG: nuclear transport factor 2 family protein [Bacteroidetes bacterium]|nr:nuclear transport factor 2 family protein [Bacteroidota bacterium]
MKKLIPLFLIIIGPYSCTDADSAKQAGLNEKLIQKYFEHFNRHDWKSMANMYAASADFKDPSLGPGTVKQTRQQVSEKYAELQKTFPDVHDDVKAIYTSGNNHVIVEFISTGTAADSSKFTLPVCTIFTIESGLITGDFTYYDNF